MTDVPDLVRVSVVAPIGNSDHSDHCTTNTVCGAVQDLPWRNIWSTDNAVEVLNEHLLLQVGRFVPTKIIRERNKDKPWFDDQCRHAFGLKQEAHLRWTRDHSRVNWEKCPLSSES